MQITIENITPEFVKKYDGKLVWLRDDYLSMRGVCYHDDRQTYDLLEHVANVKEELRKQGWKFVA